MIFSKKKYIALILITCLITLGFVLMTGPKSTEIDVFNNKVFSFRRITLAPLLIMSSYIALIWLILKRSSN